MSLYKPGPASVLVINGDMLVTSSPIPLHTARVRRTAGADWVVRMVSLPFDPIVGRYGSLDDARQGAGRAVTARALADMKQVFSGVQRLVMGRDRKCPKLLGYQICQGLPVPGSVWCEMHPKGGFANVGG